MPPDTQSSQDDSSGLPILDYRPVTTPPTGRQRLAAAMQVVGELAAMLAAFAVLLTIEMVILIFVDLCSHRFLMPGELSCLAISAVLAMALIGIAIFAVRLSAKIPS